MSRVRQRVVGAVQIWRAARWATHPLPAAWRRARAPCSGTAMPAAAAAAVGAIVAAAVATTTAVVDDTAAGTFAAGGIAVAPWPSLGNIACATDAAPAAETPTAQTHQHRHRPCRGNYHPSVPLAAAGSRWHPHVRPRRRAFHHRAQTHPCAQRQTASDQSRGHHGDPAPRGARPPPTRHQ